jgi:hypothetical protein
MFHAAWGSGSGMRRVASTYVAAAFVGIAAILALPACGCPEDAAECPSGCADVRAWRLDHERNCSERSATIACTSARGGSADVECLRREDDGTLYLLGTGSTARELMQTPTWSECTPQERERLFSAPSCDAREPPSECPAAAAECPLGCSDLWASRYDPEEGCGARPEVIACTLSPDGLGELCLRGADGALFLAFGEAEATELIATPHWFACTEQEAELVAAAPMCQ